MQALSGLVRGLALVLAVGLVLACLTGGGAPPFVVAAYLAACLLVGLALLWRPVACPFGAGVLALMLFSLPLAFGLHLSLVVVNLDSRAFAPFGAFLGDPQRRWALWQATLKVWLVLAFIAPLAWGLVLGQSLLLLFRISQVAGPSLLVCAGAVLVLAGFSEQRVNLVALTMPGEIGGPRDAPGALHSVVLIVSQALLGCLGLFLGLERVAAHRRPLAAACLLLWALITAHDAAADLLRAKAGLAREIAAQGARLGFVALVVLGWVLLRAAPGRRSSRPRPS